MNNRQVHFTSYWHPDPEFEVLAPRGIKLWAQVLRELYSKGLRGKDLFTWFGKISKGGKPRLGEGFQTRKEISRLNEIIKEQSETHLYMWTYEHANVEASLHVGKVVEISGFREKFLSSPYVPVEFYKSMAQRNPDRKHKELFPVWFKLEDIRKIDFDNYKKLRLIETGEDFIPDPDPKNTLSPRQVFQISGTDDSSIPGLSKEELHQTEWKGWWEQTLLCDDWDPGQFNSPKLKEIYAEALRFSRINVPILILGERGVGKTFLAWWIRMQSSFKGGVRIKNFEWDETRQRPKPRGAAKKPKSEPDPIQKDRQKWPQMACGSFADENSLRSELFGHLEGSYTGALQDREGLLHMLNTDTLFLDEIGDLPKSVERSLIKVIEEKKYSPLGSDETHESSFRLITATNMPLVELQKKLHPDFFDRINTIILELPPLRAMPEDIDWIWSGVYHQVLKEGNPPKDRAPISPEFHNQLIDRLKGLCRKPHGLPGNLRDLRKIAFHVVGDSTNRFDQELSIDDILSKVLGVHHSEATDKPLGTSRIVGEFLVRRKKLNEVLPHETVVDVEGALDVTEVQETPHTPGQPLFEDKELISSAPGIPKKGLEGPTDTNRKVLEAFLQGKSLVEVLPQDTRMDSMGLVSDIKRYLLEQCDELRKTRRFTWRDLGGESARRAFKNLKKT